MDGNGDSIPLEPDNERTHYNKIAVCFGLPVGFSFYD
jgi:hypothetical protein